MLENDRTRAHHFVIEPLSSTIVFHWLPLREPYLFSCIFFPLRSSFYKFVLCRRTWTLDTYKYEQKKKKKTIQQCHAVSCACAMCIIHIWQKRKKNSIFSSNFFVFVLLHQHQHSCDAGTKLNFDLINDRATMLRIKWTSMFILRHFGLAVVFRLQSLDYYTQTKVKEWFLPIQYLNNIE